MQTVDSSRGMSLPSAEFFHEETVNTDLRLGDFATTPLYNIKAVVQATNISPSTLRAWERRYHMCRPQRSESGYRLYSERDVAIIRWLKTQVDAGMAISQAVAWLESIVAEAENQDDAVLPGAAAGPRPPTAPAFRACRASPKCVILSRCRRLARRLARPG